MAPMPVPRRSLAVLLMAALLAACSTPSPSTTPGATSRPIASDPPSRPTDAGSPSPAPTQPPIAQEPPPLALEEVATGLEAPDWRGLASVPAGGLGDGVEHAASSAAMSRTTSERRGTGIGAIVD